MFQSPVRITQCGHNFCDSCLNDIRQRALPRAWFCPECRQEHRYTVESLPRNFFIEKMVEKFRSKQKTAIFEFGSCSDHNRTIEVRKFHQFKSWLHFAWIYVKLRVLDAWKRSMPGLFAWKSMRQRKTNWRMWVHEKDTSETDGWRQNYKNQRKARTITWLCPSVPYNNTCLELLKEMVKNSVMNVEKLTAEILNEFQQQLVRQKTSIIEELKFSEKLLLH